MISDEFLALAHHWQDYEKDCAKRRTKPALAEFSQWLHERVTEKSPPPPAQQPTLAASEAAAEVVYSTTEYASLPIESQIAVTLHRLARLWAWYCKKLFAGLPLSSYQDFLILACVAGKGNPKKNEVIAESLLETTTGTDNIRKLVNMRLLRESHDSNDKRAIRLQLSAKGLTALQTTTQALMKTAPMIAAPLEAKQRALIAPLLVQMNEFHTYLYGEHSNASIDELRVEIEHRITRRAIKKTKK
jgi:DNA-binding MarR family transcriptional regulator